MKKPGRINKPEDIGPPKWLRQFFALIHKHWHYHALCEHINIQASHIPGEGWLIQAAPVYQEVYGGESDGEMVWAGFVFDMGAFSREDGMRITEQAVASLCRDCMEHPKLLAQGTYHGHRFSLQILLEPPAETDAVEILDTIKHCIRPPIAEENKPI